MEIHQGQLFELSIRRKGISITELAKIMGVNRRSIYNWFSLQRLSLVTINKISRETGLDLSELSGEASSKSALITDDTNASSAPKIDVWKEKYILLLEEYNQLIKKLHNIENL